MYEPKGKDVVPYTQALRPDDYWAHLDKVHAANKRGIWKILVVLGIGIALTVFVSQGFLIMVAVAGVVLIAELVSLRFSNPRGRLPKITLPSGSDDS